MLEFIIGGIRSGKSRYAEWLAQESNFEVYYIATCKSIDNDLKYRIKNHRKRRPLFWNLIEEPIDIEKIIIKFDNKKKIFIIDCLTLWINNNLFYNPNTIKFKCIEIIKLLKYIKGRILIISTEIGEGIIPINKLSRKYIDIIGEFHQQITFLVDRVWSLCSGIPKLIKYNL
ncbi:Bifunctional adenosylcobalamin biosynthesis protein CobP [Candidatus Johnevansia muelleri]|uniref:Bifunctional adenosylcobalamin biosynthesis protein n=1 Tax=Candidatus Johnevansia muelleri TaxID=1495769 RepID=A0A078KBN3_9GAMM|nr:Bifunctional adenosylcobalamin biosynthesis protein CobP [Candidatus Evansia muelleri]